MKSITCFVALLCALFTVPAFATKYYVDPSSSGSNQGTEANPWKSIADVPWYVNYFQPGDTVFFKRGQQYTGTLSINSSGSNGAPIVFMSYGTGNAPVFQYNLANPTEALVQDRPIIRLNQANYIVIDGFELTDVTMPANDHNVNAHVGYGVYIYKGNNNIIKNCTVTKIGTGVSIDQGEYNTVTGCTMHNLRMVINAPEPNWDDLGANAVIVNGSNNTITYNHIQDCWAYCYDFDIDGGAIEIYGPVSNNKIMYNTCIDNLGFMEFGSGTGGQALNNLIGYNLLINNGHTFWINTNNGQGVDVRNLQFFNNNVIETQPHRLHYVKNMIDIMTIPTASNVISMKNNIFWITTGMNITNPNTLAFNGPQLVHQSNLYHMGGGSFGFSLDGTERILNANDQVFTDILSTTNPVSWDYNLKASSAAINIGQTTGIDKDYFGRGVPSGGAPDAGIAENILLSILPLQFLSINGWGATNGNTVEWTTSGEAVDRFEIERSNTGNNFKKIAEVSSKTNTSSASIQYQFLDKDAAGDVQYYRIKSIEPGNTGSYSKVITIKNGTSGPDKLTVSPNPVLDNLNLKIPGNDFRNKEVMVVNMSGVVIKKARFNEAVSQKSINVSMLPKGAYVVKLIDTQTGGSYQTMFLK
jgi:parallel beta-helix repeat protein